MRRRKKTLIAAFVTLGAIAALLFWPRDHPEARKAFVAVRELVEMQPDQGASAFPEIADDATTQVELAFVIAKLNLTDARTRLFADSIPSGKMILGRVKSPKSVLEILQPLDVTTIVSEPRMVALSGQQASLVSGSEVAILAAPGPGAPVTYRSVGIQVSVRANVTGASTLKLKIDCELSRITGMRTIATPQGPVDQPVVKATRADALLAWKDGETLLIGGLAQENVVPATFKTPYLSELPGVGSWFCFTRQREIEEELVFLVTPRIVHPNAMARMVPRVAKQ